jgi:hypothetical protein
MSGIMRLIFRVPFIFMVEQLHYGLACQWWIGKALPHLRGLSHTLEELTTAKISLPQSNIFSAQSTINIKMKPTSFLLTAVIAVTFPTISARSGYAPLQTMPVPGIIPFSTFDVGNHSYSLRFTPYHYSACHTSLKEGHLEPSTGTHTEDKAPRPFYEKLMERCGHLGVFEEPATRATPRLLGSELRNNCGQVFVFTDEVEEGNEVQICLRELERWAKGERSRKGVERGVKEIREEVERRKTKKQEENDVNKTGNNNLRLGVWYLGMLLLVIAAVALLFRGRKVKKIWVGLLVQIPQTVRR